MPKYAVDFLAEIQEVTSATNLDDCSDSVDLLTNCCPVDAATADPTGVNNVVNALMGNAQCCFKRYPGYQAHRHVVVSRGVQCSDHNPENKYLFSPQATERGDAVNETHKETWEMFNKESFDIQNPHLNVSLQASKSKPEVITLNSEDPPELRESSKFFRKKFSLDSKKTRKYMDDDIDSLSATISNYSFRDNMMKFQTKKYEAEDQNNHQSSNPACITPVPRQRQLSYKGSMDAVRGSTTRSLTCRSHESKVSNRNECLENQSSDSFTSSGPCKDLKVGNIQNSAEYTETTAMEVEKLDKLNPYKHSAGNGNNNVPLRLNEESDHLFIASSNLPSHLRTKHLTSTRKLNTGKISEEKPIKSNSDSKCSSSVAFAKGSQEFHNNESDLSNINALRRKQKFLMRHSRRLAPSFNHAECQSMVSLPEGPLAATPVPVKAPCSMDCFKVPTETLVPKAAARTTPSSTTKVDHSRNICSQNSNRSEHATVTPGTNTLKIKRTVSFDKGKVIDSVVRDHKDSNQSCSRSTVRSKYCSSKVVKQRFYISESANIEQILRDPSDRRIKAICDRHNCDIEIYSKVPKCGFLKNIIVLAAPNSENLRKCVRSLDYSMCWCLTAQLP